MRALHGRAPGDRGGPASAVVGDRPVRFIRQVHGAAVVVLGTWAPDGARSWTPGAEGSAPEGDALLDGGRLEAVAVLVADCAPVALGSPEGVHGAVHVGWRGLAAGVVRAAVGTMRDLGASTVVAGVGPCIGPCCYEFSPRDLDPLRAAFGPTVVARSATGAPSLDLRAGVAVALERAGAPVMVAHDACTACAPGYFSHRARADTARQAVLVWRD
jgi:copper oxidase (laccase) domain-containing protein